MLYSEFAEGTGCRDNEYNHEIYRRLELMYMADDSISKQDIYEYGKKLVDNSKTPEELELEKSIKCEIEGYKLQIAQLQKDIEIYKNALQYESDPYYKRTWKDTIRSLKSDIWKAKYQIKALKLTIA